MTQPGTNKTMASEHDLANGAESALESQLLGSDSQAEAMAMEELDRNLPATADDKTGDQHSRTDSDAQQSHNETTLDRSIDTGAKPKKSKQKRKPKSQKAKKKGTGFEEYYVDAPITPAEFEEEKGLYHMSIPFAERIETAIQRFAKKRNMDSFRKNVFDKYLRSGGIDAGPKMFSGGLDNHALAENDAEGIARLTATHFVPAAVMDLENDVYVVDFEGCLKSFLSYKIPLRFDLGKDIELQKPDQIHRITGVVGNFLNYLVYHGVSPEYDAQIQASRSLCKQAEHELWNIELVKTGLPGDFNRACSQIFGGLYSEYLESAGAGEWAPGTETAVGNDFKPHLAPKIFKLGLIANASPQAFAEYEQQGKTNSIRIVNVEDVLMEVTEIIPSNVEIQSIYEQQQAEGAKPLGILKAKTWHSPFEPRDDLTEEEEATLGATTPVTKEYEFWLEDDLLQHCFIGLKLDVTVRELSIGIAYFDAVAGVHCSFYEISDNELMEDWREPEAEWLPPRARGGGALEDSEEPSTGTE